MQDIERFEIEPDGAAQGNVGAGTGATIGKAGGISRAMKGGLGTASCGPDTLPHYLVGAGNYRWSWTLQTLDAR